jgi:hypothetical protein
MKPIQSAGGELSASSPVKDTKVELLREALDSLHRDGNHPHFASLARSSRGRYLSKSTLPGIAAIFGPLLASTGSAADAATATTVANPPTAASTFLVMRGLRNRAGDNPHHQGPRAGPQSRRGALHEQFLLPTAFVARTKTITNPTQ